jgi:hypothetical protein
MKQRYRCKFITFFFFVENEIGKRGKQIIDGTI